MAIYKGKNGNAIRYIDLFCGIGGFRFAAEQISAELGIPVKCVFSSEIDEDCLRAYEENFGERPAGDINSIKAEDIPDHDILLAGFPCQPFSIIGHRKGFEDIRGTLFFEIARILEAKKPKAFVLENVKLLAGHNNGKTLKRIMTALSDLGYNADFRIFNALDYGLPQKRERIFIVGFKKACSFDWPKGGVPMIPLNDILEENVPEQYYASAYIRKNRLKKQKPTKEPTIWHENKAGHISAYPFSCALRAGASYNYLLVNGERRLTMREMLRLQGFPESFKIVCNYSQTRKQAGNSIPVPVANAVLKNLFIAQGWHNGYVEYDSNNLQYQMVDGQIRICEKGKNMVEEPRLRTVEKYKPPYPLNKFPKEFAFNLGREIVYLIGSRGTSRLEGEDWEEIFARIVGANWKPSNVGLDDVVLQQTAWGAKTVKTQSKKGPSSVSTVRLISGRNSPVYSFGDRQVSECDPDELGEKILSIWNERVAGIRKLYKHLRTIVLIKSDDLLEVAVFEFDTILYPPENFKWKWNKKNNLEGFRIDSKQHTFTWQPHGSQFTIIEKVPPDRLSMRIKKPPYLDRDAFLKAIHFDASWIEIIK